MAELDSDSDDDSDNGPMKPVTSAVKSLNISSDKKDYKSQQSSNIQGNKSPPNFTSNSKAVSTTPKNNYVDDYDEKVANFGSNSKVYINSVPADTNTPAAESKDHRSNSASQLSELRKFLNKPCNPLDPPLCCYVERYKCGLMQQPLYMCYLDAQAQPNNGSRSSAARYPVNPLSEDAEDTGNYRSIVGNI